jgi:hypothetical protein
MNLPLSELSDALRIKTPAATPSPPPPPPAPAPAPVPVPDAPATNMAAPVKPAAGVVDPMQWWGALTQQFTEIASKAMKDAGLDAASAPELAAKAPARASAKKMPARKTASAKRATPARKRGA